MQNTATHQTYDKCLRAICLLISLCFIITYPVNANADNPAKGKRIKKHLVNKDISPQGVVSHHTRTPNTRTQAIESNSTESKDKSLKGWDHLYGLLVASGIDTNYLKETLIDPRMPANEPLVFRIPPRESHINYKKRNIKAERKQAMQFYNTHKSVFLKAEEAYCVPSSVILALLQIETRCGKFTGKSRVLPMLSRLASARDEKNINDSFEFNSNRNPKITKAQVIERAHWLEDRFLPHVIATFRLAKDMNIHPLEIFGSSAGAIGITQFLPGNYFLYGVDGDEDKNIDLNNPADAIPSIANYLKSNGWATYQLSSAQQKEVIWTYNRSDPYVSTTLAMSKLLESENKINSNPKECVKK